MNRLTFNYSIKVLLLGLFSGFPQILSGTLFTLWLVDAGYANTEIAALGMVSFFYAFNWLVAPFIDRYSAFGLGRRKFWLILCQLSLFIICLGVSQLDIKQHLLLIVMGVLGITLFSAVQDVAIDALRIEITPKTRPQLLSLGSALAVLGWNTSFYLISAIGIYLHDYLKTDSSLEIWHIWKSVYFILSFVFLLMAVITYLFFKEPQTVKIKDATNERGLKWIQSVLIKPFAAFIDNNGLRMFILLLLFAFLFRIGEAFLGRMATPFYKDMGYTDLEIAQYVKIVGWLAISGFSLLSGFIGLRIELWKGLMIGGVAMASTNLLYAFLAAHGHDNHFLLLTVIADQFTSAFASIFFITFISRLCDEHYTASQFALFASVGTGARVLFSGSSGYVLEHYLNDNWIIYFVLTTIMVLPSLLLLWFMRPWIAQKLKKDSH